MAPAKGTTTGYKVVHIKEADVHIGTFQRPLDEARVERIARAFDWALFRPLTIASNSVDYLVDGQHTFAALKWLVQHDAPKAKRLAINLTSIHKARHEKDLEGDLELDVEAALLDDLGKNWREKRAVCGFFSYLFDEACRNCVSPDRKSGQHLDPKKSNTSICMCLPVIYTFGLWNELRLHFSNVWASDRLFGNKRV